MKRLKVISINIFLVLFSVLITAFIAEKIYQKLLFSDNPAFDKHRDPGLYADPDSEDAYWKLYNIFGGEFKPPENPHPYFGWIGHFHGETHVHGDIKGLKDKRPVLLFGDSFAMCVEESDCFQDILNQDSTFSKDHYLLNYGVGGYGVDQIAMLTDEIIKHYQDPFVVFSVMITDLDRSLLSFRTGQKPYFILEKDSLICKGVPINPDPDKFLENNPPEIMSYLYRKFLYGNSDFLPDSWVKRLKKTEKYKEKKIVLNKKILEKVLAKLRKDRIDHVFLIFHFLRDNNDNFGDNSVDRWRNNFLRNFLEQNDVPYIWSMELIEKDATYGKDDIQKYIRTGDGHPTTHFNKLISREIRKAVLAAYENKTGINRLKSNSDSLIFTNQIAVNKAKITSNDTIMNSIRGWAKKKDLSIDEMIHEFAVYCTFEGKDPYKLNYK